MPNRRDPNKVLVSCYIDKELRDLLRSALAKNGITFTDYIQIQILKLLNESADEVLKKLKEQDGRTVEGKAKRNRKKGELFGDIGSKKNFGDDGKKD